LRIVISVRASTGLPATAGSSENQHRLLAQHLARLQYLAVGAEHRHPAEPDLHELQRHQPVVDLTELDAAELDHVDLDAARRQAVEQALDQLVRLVVLEEGPVEQVHPDDPERLLLRERLHVEHPHVHDDLAWLVVRLGLELHAHPAMALVAAAETARHHRVGEREKAVLVAALVVQSVDVELELVVEHALQPPGRDVAVHLAVDGVADRHVVGGDRLSDRAGRAAHPEEPAHDLLARPDLGDRSVPARIEVDPQRLLMRVGLVSAGDELCHPFPPSVATVHAAVRAPATDARNCTNRGTYDARPSRIGNRWVTPRVSGDPPRLAWRR
jgi:hypothetical protein